VATPLFNSVQALKLVWLQQRRRLLKRQRQQLRELIPHGNEDPYLVAPGLLDQTWTFASWCCL